jgi:hypothetical protein
VTKIWKADELEKFANCTEIEVASFRPDSSLRPSVTIWAVRVDDALYVRSAYGPDNPWYRHAVASGSGRIRTGTLQLDVKFVKPPNDVDDAIDAAYRAKYDRYGPKIVGTVVGPRAAAVTLRLDP